VTETVAEAKINRIEASSGLRMPDLRELFATRELLYVLAWRDVKISYKQTVLGAAWAIIQPVVTMVVFTLIFGRVGKIPSDGVPYPLFSLAGLVVWTYFSTGLVQSANSLVSNVALITKVYFPRILIPAGALVAGFVDLAISMAVLLAVMLGYGVWPTFRILAVVPIVAMCAVATLGVSAGLGALNVRFRDVRYVVPFLTQVWLLATPVAYPASLLHQPWRTLSGINPMAGVIEGFRWATLGGPGHPALIATSALSSIVIFSLGVLYFFKVERSFADVA
jgi:lipopolysaccharide transport system permease protein